MPRNFAKNPWVTFGVAVFVASLILVSVAGAAEKKQESKKANGKQPEIVELAWPEPPLEPRIKVVNVLGSEKDLGRKTTWRESMMKFLTGAEPQIAHIYQPRDLAVSEDGQRVYATDFGESVIFIFDLENGKVSTLKSESPFGIALDASENLYVAEQQQRRIAVMDRSGNILRTIQHEKLIRPTDITIDRKRNLLYVADPARKASEEHSVKVFDLAGNLLRTVGNGKGDCKGCLLFPTYVAVDQEGKLYVTSTLNARVDVFDPAGKYVRTIGGRGTSFGLFDKPKGVALDTFGNVYVADSGWSNVQIFNPKGEVLLFFGGRGDYPGLLKNPTGVAIDKDNKIYVADYLNYRVTVYQLVNTTAADSFVTLPGPGEEGAQTAEEEKEPLTTASATAQE